MSAYICPVCGGSLDISGASYKCGKNHCFDISAKGYVNLLTSDRMNSKLPGDNKMMVNARRDFLEKGYYSHLADKMTETVCRYCDGMTNPRSGLISDAGCGEGYYTKKIYDALCGKNIDFSLAGFDISKFACAVAAKRFTVAYNAEIAAASIFHMPLADKSTDIMVTMFAPYCHDEYVRVLKDGGILIMAIPAENHLLSLKEAVYDEPYKNHVQSYEIDGFELLSAEKAERKIYIDNNADIQSLFSMTPYYYKTGEDGHRRVEALQDLETEAAFEVLTYRLKRKDDTNGT